MKLIPLVDGVETRGHIHEESARQQAGRLRSVYEHHELTINNGSSNLSLEGFTHTGGGCTCNRGAFTNIDRAQRVIIRNMGVGNVTVRFNGTTANHDPVTIRAGEIMDFGFIETEDVFFTNSSGSNVLMSVTLS